MRWRISIKKKCVTTPQKWKRKSDALRQSSLYIRFSRGVIQCPIFPATSPWHARDLWIWQSRRASRDQCSISSSDWDVGSEYCGMPRAMRIHLTPAIRTGFVFCFVNCGLLLVTGLAINKGMIPSGYGYSAIVLYIVCIGTSLLLQFLLWSVRFKSWATYFVPGTRSLNHVIPRWQIS